MLLATSTTAHVPMDTALSSRVLRGKDEGSGEAEEMPRPRCFAAAAGSA